MGLVARFLTLFGPPAPWRKAFGALEDRLEGLESRVEKHRSEFKELRGYVYAMKRAKTAPQDAAQPPIEEPEEVSYQPRPVASSEHLSRRFRLGG